MYVSGGLYGLLIFHEDDKYLRKYSKIAKMAITYKYMLINICFITDVGKITP